MAEWHTLTTAREQWPDAAGIGDEQLEELLTVARLAVLAYAKVLEDDEDPPENYRYAQLMQAQNVWNSSEASPSGDFDSSGYGLTTFPLDWAVRQVLRPKRGFPVIG